MAGFSIAFMYLAIIGFAALSIRDSQKRRDRRRKEHAARMAQFDADHEQHLKYMARLEEMRRNIRNW